MMKTGWIEINGQTFYLQPQSNGHRGEMLTGWQQIDGKWYWFQTESNGNKGALLKNGVTPDGYKVGADGSWVRN
jgi:glucan-binding YG repeat protein